MTTAEEAMEVEEVEMDVDEAKDATVTTDKNVVHNEASTADPTATVLISEWIVKHVPMDKSQTQHSLTAKEAVIVTVLEGVRRRMMTLKVK